MTTKCVALLTLGLLVTCYPATAKPYHHYHRYAARTAHHGHLAHRATVVRPAAVAHHVNVANEQPSRSGITCEMVRAYVAQVGLAQATAMAESNGITPAERERAKRCLAEKS